MTTATAMTAATSTSATASSAAPSTANPRYAAHLKNEAPTVRYGTIVGVRTGSPARQSSDNCAAAPNIRDSPVLLSIAEPRLKSLGIPVEPSPEAARSKNFGNLPLLTATGRRTWGP